MANIVKVIITPDSETSDRAGAGNMFQVANISALDSHGKEVALTIDQGKHFDSEDQIREELGLDKDVEISIEGSN